MRARLLDDAPYNDWSTVKKLFAVTLAFGAFPQAAMASAPTPRHFGVYRYVYRHARAKFGLKAIGCKLGRTCHQPVTDAAVLTSTSILERMLYPASVTSSPASYGAASVSYVPTASGALPYCTWGPESGGNWSAVNPSSGAGGRYQILPSTWSAYGGAGAPQDASPAQQTAIAQKIYATAGPSQWVNC